MAKVKIWPICELKVDRRFFVFEEDPVLAEDAIMLMNRREEKFAKKLIRRTFFCSRLCTYTFLVVSGSALTDHQTNRIKARRLLVNFVQLAKEEEERMERRICVNLA